MRIATVASVALIAFSSAALAQMTSPGTPQTANNSMMNDLSESAAEPMNGMADNMMDDSASPPPTEPK